MSAASRTTHRPPAALSLLAALVIGGVSACGGGSASSTATGPRAAAVGATAARASSDARTLPGRRMSSSSRTLAGARTAPSARGAARARAGAAASFLVVRGDNSIPEYGHEAPAAERARALGVVTGYLRARAAGHASSACAYLTVGMRRQLRVLARAAHGPRGCGPILAALSPEGPARSHAEMPATGVSALRTRGANAFVLFHAAGAAGYVMPLRWEADEWKMTKLAPIPYPPVPSALAGLGRAR